MMRIKPLCLALGFLLLLFDGAAATDAIDAQIEQARAYQQRSEIEQAEALYHQLLDSAELSPSQLGDALTGLATTADMKRDNESLKSYADQALAHALQHPELVRQHAHALLLLGIYHANVDNEPESTRQYLQALAITRPLPLQHSVLPDVLINLAINDTDRGDFSGAEQRLLEALDLVRGGPDAPSVEARILANLAYVYGTRNEVTRARDVYLELVDIARQQEPDSLVLANRLSNLGAMQQGAGDIDAAKEALAEALEIQTRLAPESLDMARTYYALAEIAEKQNALELALAHYRHSLAIAREATNGAQITYPLRGVSGVLIELQRYDEALPLLHEAVERAATHTPLGTQHARSLGKLGILHALRGEVDEAISTLEQAVDILELQYTLLGGSAITLAEFSGQFERIYVTLSELYLQIGSTGEALNILEHYRERALLINFDLTEAARAQDTPEQRALRAESTALHEQFEAARDNDAEREILRTRLLLLQRKLSPLDHKRGTDIKAQALSMAQQQLEDQDRILFYNLSQNRRVVFVISRDQVHVIDLPVSRQQLDAQIGRIRTLLQTPASALDNVQTVSAELYQMLLTPLAQLLPETGRLIVIPHQSLHLLPFGALYDSDRGQYLIQRYDIVQTGSLSAVARSQQRSASASPGFTGFAYSGSDQLTDVRGQPLGRLHGVEQEVERAAEALAIPSHLYTGSAALKSHLSEAANARFVHFATHAVIDMASPRDSYLVLAPDTDDDGRLSLWQIANGPRLQADLVVLSACSTAVGPHYAGEGVLGLSKAFSLAGANGVAASLWPVADDSTTVLMQHFYQGLAADQPAAVSLRQAQLQLLNEAPGWLARTLFRQQDYRHPYYWAPFVVNR